MSEIEDALTALQRQVEILDMKVSNLRTGEQVQVCETITGRDHLKELADSLIGPQNGCQWECGDEALRSSAILRIIIDNKISDQQAIEHVDELIYKAGKRFAEQITLDDVPF